MGRGSQWKNRPNLLDRLCGRELWIGDGLSGCPNHNSTLILAATDIARMAQLMKYFVNDYVSCRGVKKLLEFIAVMEDLVEQAKEIFKGMIEIRFNSMPPSIMISV
jgi:hypothetical protein